MLPHLIQFLPFPILVAAFLGSSHCVLMCGPLVTALTQSKTQQWLYNIGRLSSYLALGFLASVFGFFLSQSDSILLQTGLGVSLALMLIMMGLTHNNWVTFRVFNTAKIPFQKIMALLIQKQKTSKMLSFWIFLMGSLSVLLPCGYLYGAVVGIAVSATPSYALLGMFFFWLGTLPGMLFFPWILQKTKLKLGPVLKNIYGWVLIGSGLFVLYLKLYPLWVHAAQPSCCH